MLTQICTYIFIYSLYLALRPFPIALIRNLSIAYDLYVNISISKNLIFEKFQFLHSSSPDSLSAERGDNKSPGTNASPAALYKLTVPLLRCEVVDVRDAAVQAIGKVNADALK